MTEAAAGGAPGDTPGERGPIRPRVELLATRKVYTGRVFSVREDRVRLPSGLVQEVGLVEHPGAVAIAALLDSGELLLVRQYRHAVGDWLLEVPAGRIEPGEDPLHAAQRELEEETGFQARRWRELRKFYASPGFCSELLILFLAQDLTQIVAPTRRADADEELELARSRPGDLLRGGSVDAKTLLAALELVNFSSEP